MSADDRAAIHSCICAWQLAFDRHDWTGLAGCLTETVRVDYSDLRGEGPTVVTATEYAEQRRQSLDHLDLQHNHTNLVITEGDDETSARATCNFQVLRFERGGSGYFHSFGSYELELAPDDGRWRIAAITQEITRSFGDPSLHAAQGTARS